MFVLSLENNVNRNEQTRYFLSIVEIKDFNVMIDEQNSFDQPVNSNWQRR